MNPLADSPALPRDVRALPQRDRLIWAMVRVAAGEGYEAVTVADVVAYAGVSRSTFYEEFENKDECLFAAYERVIDVLVDYVAHAARSTDAWPEQIRLGLGAFLAALAAEPAVARMAVVEVPGAGPDAQERYRDALERFLPFFERGRAHADEGDRLPDGVELMSVGGAEAIIFDEIVGRRTERLPDLLPEILFAVLVPYLGPEQAAAEMQLAA